MGEVARASLEPATVVLVTREDVSGTALGVLLNNWGIPT
jgi:hypothetical protein